VLLNSRAHRRVRPRRERFTDAVIAQVNALLRPVVFLLWGSYAQRKVGFADRFCL